MPRNQFSERNEPDRFRGDGFDEPRLFVERRKRTDWISRTVTICSIVGWIAIFIMTIFLDRAQPPGQDFFTRFFKAGPLRTSWNSGMLRISLAILILVFFICVIGLVCNLMRRKRKSDKIRKSNIILMGITVVGIALFLWRFGNLI